MTAASARATGAPPLGRPGALERAFGLGSLFGKTFRDSRRTALGLGVVLASIVLVTAASLAAEFDTIEKRLAFAGQLDALPPALRGMLGEMVNIERLGGFLSWRTINFLPTIHGIWSVVAFSGLLAGELARGSLDLVATTPLGRLRLAGADAEIQAALGIGALARAFQFGGFLAEYAAARRRL